MRRLFYYYIYLLVVWGFFRFYVKLPDVIVELWFKPVIWLTPLFWWGLSLKGGDRIRMFGKEWVVSLLFGMTIGLVYYVLIKRFSFTGVFPGLSAVGIVVATSVIEELVFSGFVAGYLDKIKSHSYMNLLFVGVSVALLRLPILWFVYNAGLEQIFGALLFSFAVGMINAWIRTHTKSVLGSVVARIGAGLALLN